MNQQLELAVERIIVVITAHTTLSPPSFSNLATLVETICLPQLHEFHRAVSYALKETYAKIPLKFPCLVCDYLPLLFKHTPFALVTP